MFWISIWNWVVKFITSTTRSIHSFAHHSILFIAFFQRFKFFVGSFSCIFKVACAWSTFASRFTHSFTRASFNTLFLSMNIRIESWFCFFNLLNFFCCFINTRNFFMINCLSSICTLFIFGSNCASRRDFFCFFLKFFSSL